MRAALFARQVSLLCLPVIVMAGPTVAAEIKAGTDASGNRIIVLNGPIEPGDAVKLEQLKRELEGSSDSRYLSGIHLNSPGGNYGEALKIADVIAPVAPIGTRVDDGSECYSACALIFMAGHTGGGSAGIFTDRRIHFRGKLGFHAPYLANVDGRFSGPDIENTYRLAVASIRSLIERKFVPNSLLVDMLSKGPNESLMLETVDQAGRWDIQVTGFKSASITRKMFCTACENHSAWRKDQSSHLPHTCDGLNRTRFNMMESGARYFIRILFDLARGLKTECKLLVDHNATTFNGMPFVVGTFGPPGSYLDNNDLDRFQVYPFHYHAPSTRLVDLEG
jgi:hypothetical protein